MSSAPSKPAPPKERKFIKMKDRKGVNINKFFKKRDEEKRRLEGK